MAEFKTYKKRPAKFTVSESVSPDNMQEIADWCGGNAYKEFVNMPSGENVLVFWIRVATRGGNIVASIGDRVLEDEEGIFHVVNPVEFDESFEVSDG